MALVITRKEGQRTILVDKDGKVVAEITSLDLERGKHRFCIHAPIEYRIYREEIAPDAVLKQLTVQQQQQ